jgi:hypothetical protein
MRVSRFITSSMLLRWSSYRYLQYSLAYGLDRTLRSFTYKSLSPRYRSVFFRRIFVYLAQHQKQKSKQNVYNPTKLVESLHLRTTEQQDAQEFVMCNIF